MNKQKFEIQPKKGLNGLTFGASAEEATHYFGEPTEIEALEKDNEDDLETELWYYDDDGVCLFFEGEPDLELTSIEVNNQEAILFGKLIFEMSEDQIIELMKENGYIENYSEDEEWGEKLLSFEDALIDFYFEEGKLVSLNWSTPFSE